MTPDERQAATLAALDKRAERLRQIQTHAERTPGMRRQRLAAAEDLVITAGRRSILVRHAPIKLPSLDWVCDASCPEEHGEPPFTSLRYAIWPCPDWRDAAVGLEVPDADH